jgi:tRNA pseudouridine55 synthase
MEDLVKFDKFSDISSFLVTKENFKADQIPENAIYLFDKPEGWSSFKLVKRIKYITKSKRVGHAGTLDPLATGLMIVCTGKCTKMIEQIQDMYKVYTGLFNFGKTTPSFDLETPFDMEYEYGHIMEDDINKAVLGFTGVVTQTPPIYSAIKVNGTRAYKMARQGETVEIKSRQINIYSFQVDGELPSLSFKVNCSKGTYIRTLAHDFAKELKSGCYLTELRRTQIGDFNINNAFDINEFQRISEL